MNTIIAKYKACVNTVSMLYIRCKYTLMILKQTQLILFVQPVEQSIIAPIEPEPQEQGTYIAYVVQSVSSYERIIRRYGASKQAHPPINLIDKLLST